jgi:hypothetical protein
MGVGTDTIRFYARSERQPALAAADHDRSARVDVRIRRRAMGGGTKRRQPNRHVTAVSNSMIALVQSPGPQLPSRMPAGSVIGSASHASDVLAPTQASMAAIAASN